MDFGMVEATVSSVDKAFLLARFLACVSAVFQLRSVIGAACANVNVTFLSKILKQFYRGGGKVLERTCYGTQNEVIM
jgi:hypothetical protein